MPGIIAMVTDDGKLRITKLLKKIYKHYNFISPKRLNILIGGGIHVILNQQKIEKNIEIELLFSP